MARYYVVLLTIQVGTRECGGHCERAVCHDCKQIFSTKRVLHCSRNNGRDSQVVATYDLPGKANAQATRINREYARRVESYTRAGNTGAMPPNPDARVHFFDADDLMELTATTPPVDDVSANAEARMLAWGEKFRALGKT